MHNNFYLLRKLAEELDQKLLGYRFSVCFSQDKDELILGLTNGYEEFWIRATLIGTLNCLSFPEQFYRTRRNSADLFSPILEKSVLRVRVGQNERHLIFELRDGLQVLFKMHGRRSNVVLFTDDEVIEIFHNKFASDFDLELSDLDRPISQSAAAFQAQGFKNTFPTFGKKLAQHLTAQGEQAPKWETVQHFLGQERLFFIVLNGDLPELSLFESGEVLYKTHTAVEALNYFYQEWTSRFYLQEEKKQALRKVERRLRQTESYLRKAEHKIDFLENDRRYQEIGHILMANLHQIPARAAAVTLEDFYNDQPITIKLKKELSPADNAAVYYRKAKNQGIEEETLLQNIEQKEEEKKKLRSLREEILGFERVKALRKFLKTHKLDERSQRQSVPEFPFRVFEFRGYAIWVGKNAKNNDLLTQRYAHKNDLWLHARSVSGSHVIVKQKNTTIPQDVVERAAQLAAYYSKRKSEGICPVIYTPKKFVRKPKGAPLGAVVVEKEEVIMVEPKL